MTATSTVEAALLERAMHPELRIGHALLELTLAATDGRLGLLTQPAPYAALDPAVSGRFTAVEMVESLDADALEELAVRLPGLDVIVGLGGGMTLDAAKFVAWRRGCRLILAPSIVSADAAVTNTIAVRRGGTVVYEGFVVADVIVADLDLIASAPARLNRAGVGDLLSIHTGLFDWRLGAAAGRIAFDDAVAARAGAVLERLYGLADDVAAVTDLAIEAVVRGYVEINELCLQVGHSGPEEGSEHYFGYHVEALTGRSFVHGELIGLGTVLMATLQDNDPGRPASFLDACGVEWRPHAQGLDRELLRGALLGLHPFVRAADLPYSIIDEVPPVPAVVDRMLDAVLSGGS